IHRVRLSATIDVDPADRETGVRGGSHHSHQITILGHRYSATRLLPGLAGRNENDLIQPEPRLHLAGGNEVTMVNRVEGAAHDADATCAHYESGYPFGFSGPGPARDHRRGRPHDAAPGAARSSTDPSCPAVPRGRRQPHP